MFQKGSRLELGSRSGGHLNRSPPSTQAGNEKPAEEEKDQNPKGGHERDGSETRRRRQKSVRQHSQRGNPRMAQKNRTDDSLVPSHEKREEARYRQRRHTER